MTQLPAEMYYWISVVRALGLIILIGSILCAYGIFVCVMVMIEKPEHRKKFIKGTVALSILLIILALAWVFIPPVEFIRAYYGVK